MRKNLTAGNLILSVLATVVASTGHADIGTTAAIHKAANYLASQTKADGMFVYRLNTESEIVSGATYNILRHAGTIYAMSMYCKRYPDDHIRQAVVRAGHYLRDHSLGPIPGEPDLLAVWSRPKLTTVANRCKRN